MPMLVQHGTADTVCDVDGSRRLIEHASSSDKYLIEYPDAHHDILRERYWIADEALRHTLAWLEHQVTQQRSEQ